MEIAQALVNQGAQLFGTEVGALAPLASMDGVVFSFVADDQGYILKFVPTIEQDAPVISERWSFARYLAANGVSVAQPVLSRAGNLIELLPDTSAVATPGRHWAVTCSLRADGSHPDWRESPERNDALIELWGRTLGRMHALSHSYAGGTALPGALDECDSFTVWCERSCGDPEMVHRWQALREWMATLPQTPDCYGVVHNDLHPQNMLVSYPDGRPALTVIDFDVCVRHWYMADIAVSVFPATWDWIPAPRGMTRPRFVRHFWERFAAGYQREQPLDPEWIKRLPAFLRAHQMLLYVVFTDEWHDGARWQKGLLAHWREQIISRQPVADISFVL